MKKRYKTRPGRILNVRGIKITDDPAGVSLPPVASVLEHVRLGRLLLVPAPEPQGTAALATQGTAALEPQGVGEDPKARTKARATKES
jgi:hypothetical protein